MGCMQLGSTRACELTEPRWAWIGVADVALDDLRIEAPGDVRRASVFERMRVLTDTGARATAARLRVELDAAGLQDVRVEERERLWIDGSAIFRIDIPTGVADAARAVDDLLERAGARMLDGGDLPARGAFTSDAPRELNTRHHGESRPQWFADELGFTAARKAGLTGEGVRLAVVDSGVDTSHGELREALRRGRVHDRFGSALGSNGHGTFVAGIVAGARTGLAPAVDLVSSRTYGDAFADHQGEDRASRFTQRANNVRAIQDAISPEDGSRGADVVVASWGILDSPGVPATDYDRAMATVAAAGVVVVAAAGNDGARDGGGTLAVPAQLPDVIAVGGVDRAFDWHPRASVGPSTRTGLPKPDLAAPVVDIRSTSLGGGAADTTGSPDGGFAGTSASAPIVASLVALLVQAVHDRGQASPDVDEVRTTLPLLTRDVDRPGPDARTGWGVADAHRIQVAADTIVAARLRPVSSAV